MPALSIDQRQMVTDRLMGGQSVKGISEDMGVALKTIYRLKKLFQRDDGSFEAVAARTTPKRAFDRDTLIQISMWLVESPKLTLKELRERLVSEGLYGGIEEVPDQSTLYRHLKSLGFDWKQPKYSDPRAKRNVIQYERCSFRLSQDNGLNPTQLLSFDETNFYYEQATRAWGSSAKAATLEKPKGKVMRRSMFATIAFNVVGGETKALIKEVMETITRNNREA